MRAVLGFVKYFVAEHIAALLVVSIDFLRNYLNTGQQNASKKTEYVRLLYKITSKKR
jgi:hypothetical protein